MIYRLSVLAGAIALAGVSFAQVQDGPAAKPATVKRAYYSDPALLDLSHWLPGPPAANSSVTKAELAEVHALQSARTPAQVAAAKADDEEEDIFVFRTVLGEGFRAADLPLTAELSAHVHNEEGIASLPLKAKFSRPRPYQVDKTIQPVCKLTDAPNSYPSGHTLSDYLEAFTLIQMVPERSAEILSRADDYAHNRLVCGVHYASDLEASRRVAYAVFGYMLASPRFQRDLAAARAETRKGLGLSQ